MDFKQWMGMKTPSFRTVGGKSRLRNWLLAHFPKEGRIYVEPFAGRGNVFFKAKQELDFQEWHINDLRGNFFNSLLAADLEKLPKSITSKKSFQHWQKQAEKENPLGVVLEPEITWGGKGWSAGANLGYEAPEGKMGSHPPFTRDKYIPRAAMAKELLSAQGVKITSLHWQNLPWTTYGPKDFVYLDPPYHETSDEYYGQIDHSVLLLMLKSVSFRWALSGYETDLYAKELKGYKKLSIGRGAELKGAATRKKTVVTENLWMNY
ncbi:MAG: DNA adenine methylase [Proteobacteria bacterium]|jgi:site-specific DNA-adenine methylase|nr:DNA adenine methylase [Pseudomonadota bacterium]